MNITELALPGVLLLTPNIYDDERGHFFEAFNAAAFARATGRAAPFIQDNQSLSHKGVVRGLHYQLPPSAQTKLVRVVAGAIFDVAVDIRRSSPHFGRWVGEVLTAKNHHQLLVPAGFAHGFMALGEGTIVQYKVDAPYDRAAEGAIAWNDPAIGIAWPDTVSPILSAKDAAAPPLDLATHFP